MREPVTNKTEMYRRLNAGEFGNTVPRWPAVREWNAEKPAGVTKWGVQTAGKAGGGPQRMNVPTREVPEVVGEFLGRGYPVWISPMIDGFARVTLWADIWLSPTGLYVRGIEYPDTDAGWTWRTYMQNPAYFTEWTGVAARTILDRHLNPNSRDDLSVLLDEYPDHVIELSATDKCFGTVKGRNCVVWEVRAY